jgi:hypothetical protein
VKRKNSQPPPGLEPPISKPVAQRCTIELSRLQKRGQPISFGFLKKRIPHGRNPQLRGYLYAYVINTTPLRRVGTEVAAPCILDLSTRRRRVVSFTARPLCRRGNSPFYAMDRRLGLWMLWRKERITTPPPSGIEPRPSTP